MMARRHRMADGACLPEHALAALRIGRRRIGARGRRGGRHDDPQEHGGDGAGGAIACAARPERQTARRQDDGAFQR